MTRVPPGGKLLSLHIIKRRKNSIQMSPFFESRVESRQDKTRSCTWNIITHEWSRSKPSSSPGLPSNFRLTTSQRSKKWFFFVFFILLDLPAKWTLQARNVHIFVSWWWYQSVSSRLQYHPVPYGSMHFAILT